MFLCVLYEGRGGILLTIWGSFCQTLTFLGPIVLVETVNTPIGAKLVFDVVVVGLSLVVLTEISLREGGIG